MLSPRELLSLPSKSTVEMTRLINQPKFYYSLFAILLLPALLINLDAHHIFVHTDEGRRALVALEMILKNEYLAPTLNGQFYYEKPPLFNWILALSFKAFGSYSAFALRFPVAVFVFLFGFCIHRFMAPILGNAKAWIILVATITSGRILFYDSFLGLIDIGLSILVFINFMLFYNLGRKNQIFKLFVLTYLIVAVAYLMKGLPALVFQFFTIIAWAVYARDWKFIFHRYNFLGTLFFIVPVGIYYYFYEKVNPDSLLTVFEYTWRQSSQRTVTDYSIWDTVLSSLTFPFENLYHFAPWTLLIVALFKKGLLRTLWQHAFMRYLILVFAFNILVYWTSPGVHPRYLFMFLPLLFAVLVEAYSLRSPQFQTRIQFVFFGVMILVLFAPLALIFAPERMELVPDAMMKVIVVMLMLAAVLILFWRQPTQRLILLGVFLLVMRIGFNWFMLPFRDEEGRGFANGASEVVRITEGHEVYVLRPSYCHDATSFTVSSARGEVLELRDTALPGNYYIIYDGMYDPAIYTSYISFGTRGTGHKLHLVQLRE